ncbi:MAG: cell division protein FtsZ, partial [Blautia sp.]|nr:cell division protein FtsZ [Blautia sp.]
SASVPERSTLGSRSRGSSPFTLRSGLGSGTAGTGLGSSYNAPSFNMPNFNNGSYNSKTPTSTVPKRDIQIPDFLKNR